MLICLYIAATMLHVTFVCLKQYPHLILLILAMLVLLHCGVFSICQPGVLSSALHQNSLIPFLHFIYFEVHVIIIAPEEINIATPVALHPLFGYYNTRFRD